MVWSDHCEDDCDTARDLDKGYVVGWLAASSTTLRVHILYLIRKLWIKFFLLNPRRYEISTIVLHLSVGGGDSIINKAHNLYKIAVERNFTKGRRSSHVAAACLYIACRYVLGAIFLQLCKMLRLSDHPIIQKLVDPSLFIHRFTELLNRMEKKVSVGLATAGRGAAEEFLSVEIGKHDYDWLLTPPGTPLFSSVDSTDHQPLTTCQRSSSNLRSASLVKPSRLSVPQPENSSHAPRMARSSSTTRASFSNSSRTPSSVLNTSTASVNSRPTTPGNRTRTPATATSTSGPRPATSRSSTPARTRPIITTPAAEKPKPVAQTSRPSTPTTRAHFHASSMSSSGPNSIQARPSSRPTTPTRRQPPPSPNSRPSSPARSRTPAQPIILPDFTLDAPPNLRTKLPERPISAGRQRPGMELTVRGNSNVEAAGSVVSSSRRASSPAMARGRIADSQAKGSRANGHRDGLKLAENQKPIVPEKKPVKPVLGGETVGYGRTLSKNSLNMAIKHMDIRQGMSGMRGASLFPHSIRSAAAAPAANTLKVRLSSRSEPPPPTHKNRITEHTSYNNELMPRNYNEGSFESEEFSSAEVEYTPMKTIDMKVYGSSRYDPILLKEDGRSLNWLKSLDEKPDRRFHPFPEPFILM